MSPEDVAGPEWGEGYRLSPQQRFRESEKLWQSYLALGGTLDPEPDTQGPFFDRREVIAVPPFEAKYLRRGHAVHFRCHDGEAAGMRVDVMTKVRGVAPFSSLWSRRTSLTLPDGTRCEVVSLSDLVQAKKTPARPTRREGRGSASL